MPMIDVYAPADLFPAGTDGLLGKELTMAVLRAEGVATPGPFHLNNTAAFIHRMDPRAVHTAATNSARTVRVQVITPPAALTREGQKQLVKEITEIVTKVSSDPTQASRTWVILPRQPRAVGGSQARPLAARSSRRSPPRRLRHARSKPTIGAGVQVLRCLASAWSSRGILDDEVLSLPVIAGEQFGGYHHRRRPTSAPAPGEGHWVHGLVVCSLPFRRPPFSYSRLSSPLGLFPSALRVIGWAQGPFPPRRPATSTSSSSSSWRTRTWTRSTAPPPT